MFRSSAWLAGIALAGCSIQVVNPTPGHSTAPHASPAVAARSPSPSPSAVPTIPPGPLFKGQPTSGIWEIAPEGGTPRRESLRFLPNGDVLTVDESNYPSGGTGVKTGSWGAGKVSWHGPFGIVTTAFDWEARSATQLVGTSSTPDDTGLPPAVFRLDAHLVEAQDQPFRPTDGTWDITSDRYANYPGDAETHHETVKTRLVLKFTAEGQVTSPGVPDKIGPGSWGGMALALQLPPHSCSPGPCGPEVMTDINDLTHAPLRFTSPTAFTGKVEQGGDHTDYVGTLVQP